MSQSQVTLSFALLFCRTVSAKQAPDRATTVGGPLFPTYFCGPRAFLGPLFLLCKSPPIGVPCPPTTTGLYVEVVILNGSYFFSRRIAVPQAFFFLLSTQSNFPILPSCHGSAE